MAASSSPLPWVRARDGQWHHLVQVFDGTRTLLYVDGVRQD